MDGSRIRKEKVADSKIFGYVWTEAVSGKKKLRIQKYLEIVWTGPKPTAEALRFVSLF